MKITARQLRQIIKEELARTGFGRLREGAGETAKGMLNLFQMSQFEKDALQVDKELEDILNNTRVIKMGDKGQVVKVIQALVKGKLFQALENKSLTSFTKSPGGALEIQRSITALGEPDGDFGNNTKNAVMTLQKVAKDDAFQKGAKASSSELPTIDGKVGRQTLSFLLASYGASISGATARSPDAPPGDEQNASRTFSAKDTGLGPSYKPGTIDRSDAEVPMHQYDQNDFDLNEGRDLTSRLMNRWLK